MFRGVTFMVNGKMCTSISGDRLMCRIDPELHATAIQKNGCSTVQMGGREHKGYVYVDEEATITLKTNASVQSGKEKVQVSNTTRKCPGNNAGNIRKIPIKSFKRYEVQ